MNGSQHELKNVAPFVITSPLGRSGTTLLLRLAASSSNGICYGENFAGEIIFGFRRARERVDFLTENAQQLQSFWDEIEAGKTDVWMPALELPGDRSINAAITTALTHPLMAAQASQEIGRPVWGIKKPGIGLSDLVTLNRILPGTKIVFIYRNIFDTLVSYKTRGWIADEKSLRDICEQWLRHTEIVAVQDSVDEVTRNNLLIIRFEDFVGDLRQGVSDFSEFTGLSGISLEAASERVSYDNQKPEVSVPLTASEHAIADEICGDRNKLLYSQSTSTSKDATPVSNV